MDGVLHLSFDIICDFLQVSSPKEGISESMITNVFPSSIEICTPCNPSPFSSCENFREEAYMIDELNGHGCSSSCPSPVYCMDMFSSVEDITLQSLEWDTPKYMNASSSGTTWACTVQLNGYSLIPFH